MPPVTPSTTTFSRMSVGKGACTTFGGGSVELFWLTIFDFSVHYVVHSTVIWATPEVGGCIFYSSMPTSVESPKGLAAVNRSWTTRKRKVEIHSEHSSLWNLDWPASELFSSKFIYLVFPENIIHWLIAHSKDDLIEFYWIGTTVSTEMWSDEEHCWRRWPGGTRRPMTVFSTIQTLGAALVSSCLVLVYSFSILQNWSQAIYRNLNTCSGLSKPTQHWPLRLP